MLSSVPVGRAVGERSRAANSGPEKTMVLEWAKALHVPAGALPSTPRARPNCAAHTDCSFGQDTSGGMAPFVSLFFSFPSNL